jgi:hypothetical protein
VQINGIQAGHDHDAGQKPVDLKAGVDQRRDRTRGGCRKKGEQKRDPGIDARNDEDGRHGCAGDKTAIHGDIGEIVNAECDEDAHRHKGV